jgi:hypothetical protein
MQVQYLEKLGWIHRDFIHKKNNTYEQKSWIKVTYFSDLDNPSMLGENESVKVAREKRPLHIHK